MAATVDVHWLEQGALKVGDLSALAAARASGSAVWVDVRDPDDLHVLVDGVEVAGDLTVLLVAGRGHTLTGEQLALRLTVVGVGGGGQGGEDRECQRGTGGRPEMLLLHVILQRSSRWGVRDNHV